MSKAIVRTELTDSPDKPASNLDLQIHTPGSVAATAELLRELASVERVVVLGGDGMVHVAANALAGSDTVVGIIAGGTGNDAARALGLPTSFDEQCRTAAMGTAQPIDLIQADDERYAVTVAIVGLAVAINERAETMDFPKGSAKYTAATLVELPKLRRYHLSVTWDGGGHEFETNLLAVANLSHFGGGMLVAPMASGTDGRLDVVSMGPANPLTFGALLPTVFSGKHVRSKHVRAWQGSEISIKQLAGDEPLRLRADGEPWGELPVTLRCVPNALRIAM